jgi:hypothetical protein
LNHTTARATRTNSNHRPAFLSQRTSSRRQQLNHDSDRSTFRRWRLSLADDSTPRRAIRGIISATVWAAEPLHKSENLRVAETRTLVGWWTWSPASRARRGRSWLVPAGADSEGMPSR